tara:strand:- start:2014 stop:2184 length:171 start_codon:yes stop_codon:yes gene_type:complete
MPIIYTREKEIIMIDFVEQDKLEIIVEGLANGEIFMNDDGVAVDAWGDPIFEEDTK